MDGRCAGIHPHGCFNMHVAPFFTKWIRDLEDAQSPEGAYPPVAPLAGISGLTDGGPAWGGRGYYLSPGQSTCAMVIHVCWKITIALLC
jgi:hypothetical protein